MITTDKNFARYIFNAEFDEINNAIKHAWVCQLECCDIRLCDLFRSYITLVLNRSVDYVKADNKIAIYTFCYFVLHHMPYHWLLERKRRKEIQTKNS